MATENPLWLNNRVQFARLLCELVAVNERLNLHEVAVSMDLKLADVNALLERAHEDWEESKRRVMADEPQPREYTYDNLEAAACMWEHVLDALRRHREKRNPWEEYREAYGMAALREKVILHAPTLDEDYRKAVENGYDKAFDWEFVPKYMEDHVTRILT